MSGLVGEEALTFARRAWAVMTKGNGFEKFLHQVSIVSAGEGKCVAEFKVEKEMTNKAGTLHGGCTATLIDCISTLGLMTSRSTTPGVSVNLTVNYMKAAEIGDTVIIDSKTVRVGKTLAFLETVLKKKDNSVIAAGSHVKFVGG